MGITFKFEIFFQTSASDLEICNNRKKTCCTKDVEEKLHTAAIETTHKALQSATSYLSQFLSDNHLHYQGNKATFINLTGF